MHRSMHTSQYQRVHTRVVLLQLDLGMNTSYYAQYYSSKSITRSMHRVCIVRVFVLATSQLVCIVLLVRARSNYELVPLYYYQLRLVIHDVCMYVVLVWTTTTNQVKYDRLFEFCFIVSHQLALPPNLIFVSVVS